MSLSLPVVKFQRQRSWRDHRSFIKALAWGFHLVQNNLWCSAYLPHPQLMTKVLFSINFDLIVRDEDGELISSCPKVVVPVDNV